jgi:hypothetical protein
MALQRCARVALAFAVLWFCSGSAMAGGNEIRFARGAHAVTLKDEWLGETKTHTFRAKAGQRLTVRLGDGRQGASPLALTIYSYCGEEYGKPVASEVAYFALTLPCTDGYSIDVAPRHHVADKRPQIDYALFVSIR